LAAESGPSANVAFNDPNTLELRLQGAKRTDVPAAVSVDGRSVRLLVQSGINDPNAPCGGMAANRATAQGK
jgi:hypothetical protein